MKKKDIIIQLLKEKYAHVKAMNRLLLQNASALEAKDTTIVNLANQVRDLIAENHKLQDAVLPTPYQVVGSAYEEGQTFLYVYSHADSSFVRYVVDHARRPLLKVPVKFGPDRDVIRGGIYIQESAPRTGKTQRANSWKSKRPENRRIVDGDPDEAERLANLGHDVVLNIVPGQ